ncbi:MAG: HEPN domain-containing protein [Candidatus Latescibacterota bacterium]
MSGPSDRAHVVHQWVARADEDLAVADYLLAAPGPRPHANICYHAQQGVEKYVKALLVWRSVPFPRTHDTGELVALLPADVPLPATAVEQETLTDHATHTRHPGDWEPIEPDDAVTAVDLARRVRDALRVHFPDPPPQSALPSG